MITPIRRRYENKFKPVKTDIMFDKEIEDIIKSRYASGKDSRPLGRRIIQRKIIKTPWWGQTKNHLKIADFLPEEDGFMTSFSWFTIIIVAFMAIMLFAGLIYVMGLLNTTFHQVGLDNEIHAGQAGYVNLTQASDNTFGKANDSIQALRLVALSIILSLAIGTILMNFAVKVHPSFFFLYVLIVILAVIFAAPISNAYQNLLTSNVFGGILPSFTGANWIMINLPLFTAAGGILGGIFLFLQIIRGQDEGGLK